MKIASVALPAFLVMGPATAAQADSPRCQAGATQGTLSIEQVISKA